MKNIKKPTEAGMLCMIDCDMFHSFMKNTWVGDLGALSHITNNDTGHYNVTIINESVQGHSGNMPATKRASYI